MSVFVCLWRQVSCGQSGLLTSVKRTSKTPGYEVCCGDPPAEICGLFLHHMPIQLIMHVLCELRWVGRINSINTNKQCWLTTIDEEQIFFVQAYPRRPSGALLCQPSLNLPLFSLSRRNWKKPQCLPPLLHPYPEPSSTLSIRISRPRLPCPDRSTSGCPTAAPAPPAPPTPAAPSMASPSCCRSDWPERRWTWRPPTSLCRLSRTWCAP